MAKQPKKVETMERLPHPVKIEERDGYNVSIVPMPSTVIVKKNPAGVEEEFHKPGKWRTYIEDSDGQRKFIEVNHYDEAQALLAGVAEGMFTDEKQPPAPKKASEPTPVPTASEEGTSDAPPPPNPDPNGAPPPDA